MFDQIIVEIIASILVFIVVIESVIIFCMASSKPLDCTMYRDTSKMLFKLMNKLVVMCSLVYSFVEEIEGRFAGEVSVNYGDISLNPKKQAIDTLRFVLDSHDKLRPLVLEFLEMDGQHKLAEEFPKLSEELRSYAEEKIADWDNRKAKR